jgi:hypothetical protein
MNQMARVGARIRVDHPGNFIVQPGFGSIRAREATDHKDQDGLPGPLATMGFEALLLNGPAVSYGDSISNTMHHF